LCYNYGLTTFGNDYHSMCFSNNLIFQRFLEKYKQFADKHSVLHSLSQFLRNPNNSVLLKDALTLLVINLKTIRDNSFSESALQSLIEHDLKLAHVDNFNVNVKVSDSSNSDDDFSKRIDITLSSILTNLKYNIILELKIIRPNSVLVPSFSFKDEENKWLLSDYNKQQEQLDKLTEIELLDLKISDQFPKYAKYDDKCEETGKTRVVIVGDVAEDAMRQAIHYAKRAFKSEEKVYVYSVVLVGQTTFLVKGDSLNGNSVATFLQKYPLKTKEIFLPRKKNLQRNNQNRK